MHGLMQLLYTTYMKQWKLQLDATPRFSKPFSCAYFCTTMRLTGMLCILIIIHECLCAAVSFSLSSELSLFQKWHLTCAFLYRAINILYYCSVHAGNESLISWQCAVSNNINVPLPWSQAALSAAGPAFGIGDIGGPLGRHLLEGHHHSSQN